MPALATNSWQFPCLAEYKLDSLALSPSRLGKKTWRLLALKPPVSCQAACTMFTPLTPSTHTLLSLTLQHCTNHHSPSVLQFPWLPQPDTLPPFLLAKYEHLICDRHSLRCQRYRSEQNRWDILCPHWACIPLAGTENKINKESIT